MLHMIALGFCLVVGAALALVALAALGLLLVYLWVQWPFQSRRPT